MVARFGGLYPLNLLERRKHSTFLFPWRQRQRMSACVHLGLASFSDNSKAFSLLVSHSRVHAQPSSLSDLEHVGRDSGASTATLLPSSLRSPCPSCEVGEVLFCQGVVGPG